MSKQESKLKSNFLTVLKSHFPSLVPIRHEDIRSGGTPDLSVTGEGRTTWWEFKHGTPDWESKGLQQYVCKSLAEKGYCRYVIYQETKDGLDKQIVIVDPRDFSVEARCDGYNHKWLANFIMQVHNERRTR